MKKFFIYFTLFCMVLATPGESLRINEIFLGIMKDSYYTLIIENDNPGSYTEYDQNLYLMEYGNNGIISKKVIKKEHIKEKIEDDGTIKNVDHKVMVENKNELNKLISKNVIFLQPFYVNEKQDKYIMKDDGLYGISIRSNEERMVFSNEKINKKIKEICSDRCSGEASYTNDDIKVISYYSNLNSKYYVVKISLDMSEIIGIMEENLGSK